MRWRAIGRWLALWRSERKADCKMRRCICGNFGDGPIIGQRRGVSPVKSRKTPQIAGFRAFCNTQK
jgi:hypothetical protein